MELKGCGQPWFEMQIEYNERVGCCCYFKHEKEALGLPFNVDRYWNSGKIREIRGIIASNNAEGTGCEGCQYIKYGYSMQFAAVPNGLNRIQRDNWESALHSYREKKIAVDSYPVKYYLNFGLACNLNCVMCSQRDLRAVDSRRLPVEPLLAMKDYLVRANQIAIIGGEPLMLPNARKFIGSVIQDPDYSNVLLSIFTNGTLLHNYIEPFKNMKRLNICISLDSIGDAYEYIRKGATWKNTERNILAFKETGAKYGLDWSVNIAAVLMKSSIPRLVEFVDWCIEHDTPVHFVPVQAQGFSGDEAIFNYPELLNDINGWKDILNNAIAKLASKGWVAGAANPLTLMRDELTAKALIPEGEALFSRGDIAGALGLFLKVAGKDPDNVVACNNIRVSYWQMGDIKKSLQYFLKALKLDPNHRDAVLNCGSVLISLEQPEEARRLYTSFLKSNPHDEEILNALQQLQSATVLI